MTEPVSQMGGQRGVSIVTVTNRPDFMSHLFANYKRQKWKDKELIVVLNGEKMEAETYQSYNKSLPDVSVYKTPSGWPLGRCLNYGVKRAKHDIIAKFDDDDFYSAYYILEAMKRFDETDADIVGKRQFYLYFEADKAIVQGKMAGAQQVAGATIMFHKRVCGKVKFSRAPKGSDMRFLRDCVRAGFRVESTGVYNFAAVRRADQRTHTWKVTKRTFRWLRARTVARTRGYRKYVTRLIN